MRIAAAAALFATSITSVTAVGPLTWSRTGSMIAPRQNHTAALISACEVLVVGGNIGADNGVEATTLRYETGAGTWKNTGLMHASRQFHTETVLVSGGKVLVTGGLGSDGKPMATAELFDPLANFNRGVWTLTGSMSAARYSHTATLLSSGQVLVAGGIDSNGDPVASAELFNPSTSAWTSTGGMSVARHDQTATVLSNGQVLVTGGIGANGAVLSSAELYNPATGTWTSAGNMSAARAFHTATTLSSGLVLLSGGTGSGGPLASAEFFNPFTGGFSATGSMGTARESHTATLLSTGEVLVAGGKGTSGMLASAELFDPAAGVWRSTGSMATARQFHTASPIPATGVCSGSTTVGAPSDFVLVAGGQGPNGTLYSAELYNQATGTWSATRDMVIGRSEHVATRLQNGKVLVAGGVNGPAGELKSALLYDPASGSFSATGSMNIGRALMTSTLLQNGKVLVAGGLGPDSKAMSSAELYDPATGKWNMTGSMTVERLMHAATLLTDGKVLVTGGGSAFALSSAELYDPVTGTWSAAGSLSTARASHTATLLNTGEVLVAGNVAASELYDPVTGTFGTTGDMSFARAFHSATLLPAGKVLVAGGSEVFAVNEAELYDRATGAWSVTASMKDPRAIFGATLLPDGTVLVEGGDTKKGPIASAEIYDPATALWKPVGNMSTQRFHHQATLLPTGKVLVTGGVNLLSETVATAELYDSGAPPGTPDSCDGVNVVADPTGDAVNPAPGGAGPTDQADIVGISFATDGSKTNLITTMTLRNASQVPSPGTTSTTYNVVWTSSDGNRYATQATTPNPSTSLSFFWGPWDSDKNQFIAAHATTGAFNQGSNGTVTVNVPLSGIGNPTIPVTDPSRTPAVTNPFGVTFAGEGAFGDGLAFTSPMDVAPDSGAGQRWAVCVPPPANSPPIASLTGNPSSGTAPLTVTLDASGSTDPDGAADITGYRFGFGDGSPVVSGPSATANHTYNSAGTFTATVAVTDSAGHTGNAQVTINVQSSPGTNQPPAAALTATPSSGAAPLDVTLDASGSTDPDGAADITGYAFSFGDGSAPVSGASATASHTYNTAGTFTAQVTVTDSAGHTSTASATVTVTSGGGTPPPSGPLAAHLTANPLSGTAPLDVSFDASGSTGAISSYTFNFGDGSAEVSGASPTASHRYTQVGSFSASLTVSDSQGNTASQAVVITVEQAGSSNPTLPVASLAVSPANGQAPLPVAFDGSGSHDPDGDAIASYTFDFGDNSGSVTQTVAQMGANAAKISHTFDAAGTYQASLTVTDSQGQTSAPVFVTLTVATSVTVTPAQGPVAALKLTNNKGPAPLTVGFDGSKSFDPAGGSIQGYTFDFGDGSAVVTRTVAEFGVNAPLTSHVYLVPGTYTPSLSVTNQDGVVSPHPAKATVEATGPAGSKGGGAFGWLTLLPLLGIGLARRRRR